MKLSGPAKRIARAAAREVCYVQVRTTDVGVLFRLQLDDGHMLDWDLSWEEWESLRLRVLQDFPQP